VKYCYCVIRNQDVGLPKSVPGVSKVCYGDIALLVEDVTLDEMIPGSEELLKHEKIIEAVMTSFVLVPMRFGIILKSEADARSFLAKNYHRLKELLIWLTDKMEVGLKIFWTAETFSQEIEDHEVKELKYNLVKRGKVISLELIEIGKLVADKVDRARQFYTDLVIGSLGEYAAETVLNPVVIPRMILNAAFLIEKHREQAFEVALNNLYSRYESKLIFKYTGPWPPYNFIKEEFTF
jgi:hypothetical protein